MFPFTMFPYTMLTVPSIFVKYSPQLKKTMIDWMHCWNVIFSSFVYYFKGKTLIAKKIIFSPFSQSYNLSGIVHSSLARIHLSFVQRSRECSGSARPREPSAGSPSGCRGTGWGGRTTCNRWSRPCRPSRTSCFQESSKSRPEIFKFIIRPLTYVFTFLHWSLTTQINVEIFCKKMTVRKNELY